MAESRGSINVMVLFEVPAARRWSWGSCERLKSGLEVVLVSTRVEVVRSQVRRVRSQEVEYPTVLSLASKSAPLTGAVCAVNVANGPRCVTVTLGLILRRLAVDVAFGRRCAGAGGASDLRVDQRERVESWLAERMRWALGECRIKSIEAL